jgi:RHS repeat-associated protein
VLTYDAVGNRNTDLGGAYFFEYFPNSNRIKAMHSGSLTGSVLSSFSYDDEGRLTGQSGGISDPNVRGGYPTAIHWDQKNRATSIASSLGTTTTFSYDPLDYRIGRAGGKLGARDYYLEGENLEAEYLNGVLQTKYYRGINPDELVARFDYASGPGIPSIFHQDPLQTVTAMSAHDGQSQEGSITDPFGEFFTMEGGTNNRLRFTGRERDFDANLYYSRARYYDPFIGRFLSEDPLGFTQGVNFYAYVNNNPVNANDPSGEDPNIPYGSLNEARIAAGQYNAALTLYSSDSRERGSLIYQQGLQYFYTEAVTRSTADINHVTQADYNGLLPSIPSGATVLETSHSHPPPQVDNTLYGQFPSGADNRFAQNYLDKAGTLGLTNGSVLTYPAGEGRISISTNGTIYSGDPRNINEALALGASVIAPPTPLANPNAIDVPPLPAFDFSSVAAAGPAAAGGYLIYPNSPNNNGLLSAYHK